MKRLAFTFLGLCSTVLFAQQKIITKATLTTKTTIVSPDGDDGVPPPPPPSADGGEIRIVRFGGDGETKAVTYLKNNLVKTVVNNEMSINTTIRDNDKKITTTLIQMNGATTGYYDTDEDQEQMRKQMDSLMQSRQQNNNAGQAPTTPPTTEVIYIDESKKIAGIACKKALLITTRKNKIDSNFVWYAPDFKLQGITSTGGLAGFGGGRGTQLSGLDKINGFPMQYEMGMNRGRKMSVEVTKIDMEKEIKDKEFEVPKDVELKTMKDVQQMGGGRGTIQIRSRD